MNITEINGNISRVTVPYKDIYTTLYTVRTDKGVLLFDCASYDEDTENYIIPFLKEVKVLPQELKYVFISHNHTDHSGGLKEFLKHFPKTTVISRSPKIKEEYENVIMPEDGDTFLDVLKVVTIPGHTKDSSAVFDTRTKTLISGDSLQLYGIYGSGKWGSNISYPAEHIEAICKLKNIDIEHILTAHDYHPLGYSYEDENIIKALDSCINPLMDIKDLILKNPDSDDEEICKLYNSLGLPTIGVHVVTGVRKEI